jgi:hypothetical protein
MNCEHNYQPVAYNSSIVIEECTKCGKEKEYDFDDYCLNYGFPVLSEESD